MSDEHDPLAWVGKAENDYILARAALRRKVPITSGVCFHAQQCAEKYLKAMLVAYDKPFPKTHDLIQLNQLCAHAGILVEIDAKRLNTLGDHAVRVRYPGAILLLKTHAKRWRRQRRYENSRASFSM